MFDTVKLIAADMDHTLLTEKGELPPNFARYLVELEKLGIDFVAASGRPLYTLETMFPTIKHQMSFISDNGGSIKHKGEIVFKSLMDCAHYQAMVRFTEEKGAGIPVVCGLDCAYAPDTGKIHENYLRISHTNITFVKNLSAISVEADKFSIYFPHKDSKKYYETFFKPEYAGDFSVVVGDTVWIDIMNRGIHKGKAIQVLGERLGLKPEQMMAFGDTYNDKEMLQAVKYSYIVKNAAEDMQQYANFTTDSNDNFGVILILDQILKEKEATRS